MLHIVHLSASLQKSTDLLYRALDSSRDLVNILGLDDSFEIVFQDLCEVVLKNLLVYVLIPRMSMEGTYFEAQTHGNTSIFLPSPVGCHIGPSLA